jgi:hypothetical protein
MHWALSHLGLDENADERAVKRAYAALLRRHRPDEDPAGFQRLNEAYQAALAWVEHRSTWAAADASFEDDDLEEDIDDDLDDEDETSDRHDPFDPTRASRSWRRRTFRDDTELHATADNTPDRGRIAIHDAPETAPGGETGDDAARSRPPPLPPPEDPLPALLALAERDDLPGLQARLRSEPTFLSLRDKSRSGRRLLRILDDAAPPMSAPCFDALMAFFGLDDVHAHHDDHRVLWLRQRCVLAWMLSPTPRPPSPSRPYAAAEAGRIGAVRQLQRPFRWGQVLTTALIPGRPTALAGFVDSLGPWHAFNLPPGIEPRQLEFWTRATAELPAITRERFWIAAARALLLACVVFVFGLIAPDVAPDGTRVPPVTGLGSIRHWADASLGGLVVLGLYATCFLYAAYARWMTRSWPPSWPGWTVPIFGAAAMIVKYGFGLEDAAIALGAVAFTLQIWRLLRNGVDLSNYQFQLADLWWIFGIKFLLLVTALAIAFPEVGIAIAMAFWAYEMNAVRKAFRELERELEREREGV